MKIAVSGATGFIGRYVLAALAERGAHAIALVRGSSRDAGAAQIVECDLADPSTADWHRIGAPDLLIHLAWEGLPNYRSDAHVDVELPRQYAFLRACIESGLPRLLVSGTCLEYGLQSGELREETAPQPTTAYGLAKHRLHLQLRELQRTHRCSIGWLRLFYLYGAGQAPTSLYAQLRAAIARGDAQFPMSPGDQVRDFMPIETAARQIVELALRGGVDGVVNVCGGEPRTVVEQVRLWLSQWSADIALQRGAFGYPDYEPREFWGSRARLDACLETSP